MCTQWDPIGFTLLPLKCNKTAELNQLLQFYYILMEVM
jgi:hypothetical protein